MTSPLLATLESCLAETTAALARACADGGALDAAALDREQGAEFELAWAKADFEAATAVLAAAGLSDLQRQLAQAFVAEAIPRIIARLQSIALDLALDDAALRTLAASPELASLRREACSSQALARIGRAVMAAPDVLSLPTA